jgi:hypothetical protein
MRAAQASVQAVTDFYTQYMAVTTYAQSDYEQVIRHYGTPSLLAYYKAHTDGPDPITCAQFAPDSVKVRGTKDIVKMDATFSDGPALNGVTLKIVNQNGPKVDTVACPEYPNNS